MILGVQLYDSDTLFGVLGPVFIALVGYLGAIIGRGRWKDAAESSSALVKVRDQEIADLKEDKSECNTQIAALETSVAEKDAVINRELERVTALEHTIQEFGGPQIFQLLTEHSARVLENHQNLFKLMSEDNVKVVEALDRHEDAAEIRNERIINAFDQLGALLNGKEVT